MSDRIERLKRVTRGLADLFRGGGGRLYRLARTGLGQVVSILLAVAGSCACCLTGLPEPDELRHECAHQAAEQVAPLVAHEPAPAEPEFPAGWVCDPDAVAAVQAGMPVRVFADTPAGAIRDVPKSVYGWKPTQQLLGRPPPVKNQGQVGSCVSFGTNTAVERTLGAEVVRRGGTAAEWTRFVEEATYGGSRVEVGGGRIRGDGSVGAWAAQWVTKWGMVPRKKYDQADLTHYSESLCRQWGDKGVPAEFEVVAKTYPVKAFAQVKTWDDAKKAIAQDYLIAVCSNQGFSMQRDANGVSRPQGSWAHCMCLDGYHTDDRGNEYGHITNSWGPDAHRGPVGWGEPNTDGFWAESGVIDRMLRQGDSWAFSGVTGFPRREPIDWFFTPRPRADRLGLRPEVALAW